ncbi:unnamed protein product [Rotaria sordida]|uniref:Uncharacterized protein n=1 Tax=Rotaria sordida TaxID=392033 RepID=A0A819D4C7_9BILA|nr:unnamed protein product [Rotaria sordida]
MFGIISLICDIITVSNRTSKLQTCLTTDKFIFICSNSYYSYNYKKKGSTKLGEDWSLIQPLLQHLLFRKYRLITPVTKDLSLATNRIHSQIYSQLTL